MCVFCGALQNAEKLRKMAQHAKHRSSSGEMVQFTFSAQKTMLSFYLLGRTSSKEQNFAADVTFTSILVSVQRSKEIGT
jgi:hypothetical protein